MKTYFIYVAVLLAILCFFLPFDIVGQIALLLVALWVPLSHFIAKGTFYENKLENKVNSLSMEKLCELAYQKLNDEVVQEKVKQRLKNSSVKEKSLFLYYELKKHSSGRDSCVRSYFFVPGTGWVLECNKNINMFKDKWSQIQHYCIVSRFTSVNVNDYAIYIKERINLQTFDGSLYYIKPMTKEEARAFERSCDPWFF